MEKFARFVSFGNGVLKLNLNAGAPVMLIKNLNEFFAEAKYAIKVERSDEEGEATVREKQEALFKAQLAEMSGNDILREILRVFKDSRVAKIEEIK